jgi:hypothetical protein
MPLDERLGSRIANARTCYLQPASKEYICQDLDERLFVVCRAEDEKRVRQIHGSARSIEMRSIKVCERREFSTTDNKKLVIDTSRDACEGH